jgi:hypothetical protein
VSAEDSSEKVNTALSEIVFADDGSVVTRWVLVAEVMNMNEELPSLWMMSSENMTSWQSKGMLMHALDRERGATFAENLREED